MDIQTDAQEESIKRIAFNELKKALSIYKEQKDILKKEFIPELILDKEIVKKLESRLSLLNAKIATIALALAQTDQSFFF